MRLALIGTGLIGGSAAWAFQKAGVVDAVTACDISMGAAEKAVSLGIADRATAKVADAVSDADCILVAVPVLAMEGVFAEITEAMRQEAWVTDVGSTRCGVIAAARKALGERFSRYAPVHPIAGGEMPGVEYADSALFSGAKVISTPTDDMNLEAVAFWEKAWEAVGAKLFRMDFCGGKSPAARAGLCARGRDGQNPGS